MESSTTSRVCAFCGRPGGPDTRYAAGMGVLIDEECVHFFADRLRSIKPGGDRRDSQGGTGVLRRHEISDLTDQDLLDTLPQIASAAGQVNQFLAEWVESIRARKMSWTTIGNAMGISRQAAWERFTRVLGPEKRQ